MISIKDRLQQSSKIESVDIVNFDKVSCKIEFREPLQVMEILNTRLEEFITLVFYNNRLFVMGFMGMTSITKEVKIDVIENEGNKAFSFSVKRDLLKILDKKEELKLNLNNGLINWSFKFGEGYIVKTMRPTSSIYEIKKYLDFILNYEIGNKEGTVDLNDVRLIHKTLMKVESNPMARNVVLGSGYMYAVLPAFAVYKPCSCNSNTLLTENIITNLPKTKEEFEIRTYKGFSGLTGKVSGTYFIFKSMQNKDLIEPYIKLKIDWVGKAKGMHSVIKVITFGDKLKEITMSFNAKAGTVTVKDTDNDNNQFIGLSEVIRDYSMQLSSVIQEFSTMEMIGYVSDPGKEYIKAVRFEEGEICLLR